MFKTNTDGRIAYLKILQKQDKPAPLTGSTASGYGKAIPTGRMVQTEEDGPFRRVYCCIFSNIGTCYVRIKGERWVVEE